MLNPGKNTDLYIVLTPDNVILLIDKERVGMAQWPRHWQDWISNPRIIGKPSSKVPSGTPLGWLHSVSLFCRCIAVSVRAPWLCLVKIKCWIYIASSLHPQNGPHYSLLLSLPLWFRRWEFILFFYVCFDCMSLYHMHSVPTKAESVWFVEMELATM